MTSGVRSRATTTSKELLGSIRIEAHIVRTCAHMKLGVSRAPMVIRVSELPVLVFQQQIVASSESRGAEVLHSNLHMALVDRNWIAI